MTLEEMQLKDSMRKEMSGVVSVVSGECQLRDSCTQCVRVGRSKTKTVK